MRTKEITKGKTKEMSKCWTSGDDAGDDAGVAPEMTPETLSGAQSLDEPAQQPSVYRERCVRDVVLVSNS